MYFLNRKEAGQKLAEQTARYKDADATVFALPRGGAVLGFEIAASLRAPLDLIITKKIGHPQNPEYAIGAVAEDGPVLFNRDEVRAPGAEWWQKEIEKAHREIKRRRKTYLRDAPPAPLNEKTAIIVDDGIATGLTMKAAILEMKRRKARLVVVAVPVIPYEIAQMLKALNVELAALDIDPYFLGAVGAYYQDFAQVTDEEVIFLLKQATWTAHRTISARLSPKP